MQIVQAMADHFSGMSNGQLFIFGGALVLISGFLLPNITRKAHYR